MIRVLSQQDEPAPEVVVFAGANGAGKTTTAHRLLPRLGIPHFVNADDIARGLSAFEPESVAVAAGRIMLDRIHSLARRRESFAFETTLAARSFTPLLRDLAATEYRVRLFFLWLNSSELAIARVTERAERGGHSIPADVVRRRYHAGLRNYFTLYQPLARTWVFYDNSEPKSTRVAYRLSSQPESVVRPELWSQIRQDALGT